MKSKLPNININKKYIRLEIRPKNEIEGAKFIKTNRKFNINKRRINEFEKISTKFNFNRHNNVKSIDLNAVVDHRPKKLKELNTSQSNLSKKNNKTISNQIKQSFSTSKYLKHNSSAKFLLTNSILNRLYQSPEEIDEIEKYEYYDKIEKTKSYLNFLKKEKEVTPKDSENNSVFNDSKINLKNKGEKKVFNNLMKTKQSIYDLIYLFNPKNMIKLWHKFQNKDQFEKYII